jgi:hypothetical protein
MKEIVMKNTIAHLISTNQVDKIDEMRGPSKNWELIEMKDGSAYYKKHNNEKEKTINSN